MYLCQKCLTCIKPNTISYLVTLKSRKKHYPYRPGANKFRQIRKARVLISPDGEVSTAKGRIKHSADPGGRGYEIEKEIRVCPECRLNGKFNLVEA